MVSTEEGRERRDGGRGDENFSSFLSVARGAVERARRRDVREMSFVTGNIVIGGGVDGDRHRNGWICRA